MFFKKEDDERCEKVKKRSDQQSQVRTLKWREKLFIHQWISSCITCFNWYLWDEDEAMWQQQEVIRMKEMKVSTQLLNTISHDWKKSYSLSHCRRRRVRQFQAWVMRC